VWKVEHGLCRSCTKLAHHGKNCTISEKCQNCAEIVLHKIASFCGDSLDLLCVGSADRIYIFCKSGSTVVRIRRRTVLSNTGTCYGHLIDVELVALLVDANYCLPSM